MKKFALLLSSLLCYFLPVNLVNGCGFSLYEFEYRIYLLQPDLVEAQELSPFFYTSDYLFYEGIYNVNEVSYKVNCGEWKKHTSYKGKEQDVYRALYQTEMPEINSMMDSLIKANKFIAYLQKHRKTDFDYYVYAKKCEVMINNQDPWELGKLGESDSNMVMDCLKEGENLLGKCKDSFLKLRINYQLIKLNYYHPGFGTDAVEIYNREIKNSPDNSWIKESARFYVLQRMTNSNEEYQYQLSRSFDNSIDKRFRCVQLFDRKHYKKILPLAKNNREKACIYVMKELQHAGRSLNAIQKIYQLDPANKDLPLLVSREINKLEDQLLTPELTEQSPAIYYWSDRFDHIDEINKRTEKAYLKELQAFVDKVIMEGKQNNSDVYRIIASHLCILSSDKEKATSYLNSVDIDNCNKKEKLQILTNKLLLQFDGKSQLTPELEKQILDYVAYHEKNPDLFMHQLDLINQVYLYIGRQLIKAGDVAKGICMMSKSSKVMGTISYWTVKDHYIVMLEQAKPADYDQVVQLISKKKKNSFEKFLTNRKVMISGSYWGEWNGPEYDSIPISVDKMLDYKSMYYVQHNQLEEALACVSKINPEYFNNDVYKLFRCFPFAVSGALEYQSNNDFYVYNKRMYLQRMCDLRKMIANNIGDQARNHFVLATGYFNMSYHGNYWIMNMPYKLSDEVNSAWSDIDLSNKEFCKMYYGCQLAEQHYLEALKSSTDTAFGALCAARAGVCNIHLQELNWRQTVKYDSENYSWNKEFEPKYAKYKQQFVKQYSNSSYYDDFVSNCYFYEHKASKYY